MGSWLGTLKAWIKRVLDVFFSIPRWDGVMGPRAVLMHRPILLLRLRRNTEARFNRLQLSRHQLRRIPSNFRPMLEPMPGPCPN